MHTPPAGHRSIAPSYTVGLGFAPVVHAHSKRTHTVIVVVGISLDHHVSMRQLICRNIPYKLYFIAFNWLVRAISIVIIVLQPSNAADASGIHKGHLNFQNCNHTGNHHRVTDANHIQVVVLVISGRCWPSAADEEWYSPK